jgi:hypothetical protein
MKVRGNANEIDIWGVYTHVVMMQTPSNINGDIGGNTQPGGARAFRPARAASIDWRAVIESATVFSALAVACALALGVAGVASTTIVALTFLAGLVVGCAQPLVRHQVAVHRVTVIARRHD